MLLICGALSSSVRGRDAKECKMIGATVSMTRAEKVAGMLCVTNFVIFVLVAGYFGGDAINGYVSEGRFFLAMNGRVTETSAGVFAYSLWHAKFTIALFGVVLLLCGLKATKRRVHRAGTA
jgi:hypothetical protein